MRTRTAKGVYSPEQISALAGISKKYATGTIHTSTRQGIEIPYIKFEDIDKVERELISKDIKLGTSGPRIRATTACPGNNWCKRGLVDTFALFERIEKELGIVCGMDQPHKFKIAISGCPNKCTRAEASEIGIHGQAGTRDGERVLGYTIYLGGCGGTTPRIGFKLDKVCTADDVLSVIEKVVKFYKENAKPRQRLALLIEEIGRETFLEKAGLNKLLKK